MNLDDLHAKLLAAARTQAPSEHVPLAFEKRITALLRRMPVKDASALWARALWRAAAACVALMVLLSTWSLLAPAAKPPATDLSQELENTVLAAAVPEQPPADLFP
jgi:hypothetical protein